MKKMLREVICRILESQVVRLRKGHKFTVVAVAGSVGKTSTKMAIAGLLESAGKRVQYQKGNYNDRVSVPLVFFGEEMPSLFNIFAWIKIMVRMYRKSTAPYEYDVVVVELGTDGPGQMKDFAYIQPDIGVLTAISPEHMLQFGTIDAVAAEELVLADYAKTLLVNVADVDKKYLENITYTGYGVSTSADYSASQRDGADVHGQEMDIRLPGGEKIELRTKYSGKQGATIVLAAVSAAHLLEISASDIIQAAQSLQPFAGRLQVLEGVNGSTIVDDTYNSSPLATRAALDLLYSTEAKQKIAILGDMNELGESSVGEHQQLGAYCRADQLSYVVTIGVKSRADLAPAAEAAGCQVRSFDSPVEAGKFVRSIVAPGTLVLAKGSQNGVFAEEAVKQLLKHPEDASKLVRQSAEWLAKKLF